ncbi:ATP-binding cassette domain-containing protein [Sediminicoccus sp. KRV36]|uniref:ATP-binding cassette domain-containing protein n=1 Tax=Sediminicoccus sp. KRV36 TaxID=3133721 RepID=UPI00200F3F98|nr:ATP-binding cassette domain-containing protein [Sediminicoccus rosea]UPY39098.1 ABC transporter ATP-binding protein [Sediminicoccus rosea]
MNASEIPALELDGLRDARGGRYALRVLPGELALIQADDPAMLTGFTELCLGLIPPSAGVVSALGLDWAELTPDAARSLRGRIGLVSLQGGWAPHLSVAESVILAGLQHRLGSAAALRERAAELCRRFGLPGLPLERPGQLSQPELARAACARAFLNRPGLLILESPLQGNTVPELRLPLLEALATAQPAACLWLTTSLSVWTDRAIPATQRHRLGAGGLDAIRRVAA